MSDETTGGKGAGVGGGDDDAIGIRKLPTLSRGERLALADVLVRWVVVIGGARDCIDRWAKSIDDLRRLGSAVEELEFDRRIAEGLVICRLMANTEDMSKNTRTYLRNLLGAAANVEFPE